MSEGRIPDYSAEEVAPNLDAIKRLGQLAAKQGMLELQIEDLEEQLKALKKEHTEYAEKLVPALMQEIGMSRIKTMGGLDVELQENVRASIPQDAEKRERAFSYLHDTGNDGIIKREITVRYGREDGKFADDLLRALEDMGIKEHATVEHEWTIHNSTLVSFLKNELKEGKNVPMDAFGAFVQRQAKLKRK
jgi:vacuolar-type H+-ATPase subunit I/STV1